MGGAVNNKIGGIIFVMENQLKARQAVITQITEEQTEMIVGNLLGDAFMETTTDGRTWRLGVEQGEDQKIYVVKKHEILQPLSSEMEQVRLKIVQYNEKVYKKYTFWTPRLLCLKPFGDAFYKKVLQEDGSIDSVKVVPKEIDKWLTPRGLAFWYMDDGSEKSKDHKLVYLNSQGFTIEDNQRLAQLLQDKFGLKTYIKNSTSKRTGKISQQIAIHGDSLEDLRKLIEPYMYPEIKQLPAPKRRRGRRKKTLAKIQKE